MQQRLNRPSSHPPLLAPHPALPLRQLAEAEKEQKRLAFERALAMPDEASVSEQVGREACAVDARFSRQAAALLKEPQCDLAGGHGCKRAPARARASSSISSSS